MPLRRQTPGLPSWVLAHPSPCLIILFLLIKLGLFLCLVLAPETTISKHITTLVDQCAPDSINHSSVLKDAFDIPMQIYHGNSTRPAKLLATRTSPQSAAFVEGMEMGFNWPNLRNTVQHALHNWGYTGPLASAEPSYYLIHEVLPANAFHLASVLVLRRLTILLLNPNHKIIGLPVSLRAEEMGFMAAVLHILSPDFLYMSTSSPDSLTSLLVLLGLEKFVLSHFALQKPLWRRGLHRIEAGVWLGLASSSRLDLVLYALAFMIPMTAETKFLIGRALVKVGMVKEDPSKPPPYSAWFIARQLSFHASTVAGTISGAIWTRWRVWKDFCQETHGPRDSWCSKKLRLVYPVVFIGEEPWKANLYLNWQDISASDLPLLAILFAFIYLVLASGLHVFTLLGKSDPQIFGVELDVAEPIAQIAARVAAENTTSSIKKEPQISPPTTVSPSSLGRDSVHLHEKVDNSDSAATSDAPRPAPGSQPITKSPSRYPDGDPTSMPPDFIPIMMTLFAIPQLLITLLSITMFAPPKLLIFLVRIISTGYFFPYWFVSGAILGGKWVLSLAWAVVVVGIWLKA